MFIPEITKMRSTLAAGVAVAAIALGGCADMPRADSGASALERAAEIESQRAELAREKEALERERAQFEAEKRAEAERDISQTATEDIEARPATGAVYIGTEDALPGQCYAWVPSPAAFETTNEMFVRKEESHRYEFTDAEWETYEELIEIKPATIELEVVPAEYTTIDVQELVKPAVTEKREVPAVFDTVTERRMIEPQRREWKLLSEIGASDNIRETRVGSGGEVMCLVESPARYEDITRQVVVEPARIEEVEIEPARYRTVKKTVLVTPATTREIINEPEYLTVSKTRLVEDQQETRIDVPAEPGTVTSTRKISDGKLELKEVLCEANMTPEHVREIQTALNEAGCCQCGQTACTPDGIMGPCTLQAARCFAEREDMGWGSNFITVDVINKLLGLEP